MASITSVSPTVEQALPGIPPVRCIVAENGTSSNCAEHRRRFLNDVDYKKLPADAHTLMVGNPRSRAGSNDALLGAKKKIGMSILGTPLQIEKPKACHELH